jgi:regulator of sigma E protease
MVSNFLTDLIVGAVVLGVLVFVHELGHFVVNKWFGVRVLIFSFGFGKRLFGIKRGVFSWGALKDLAPDSTDYRVSLLPFGGYVRMAGDDPSQPRSGDPSEFLSKPRWQRCLVALAGPAVNLALAVVILVGLYHYHYEKPSYEEQPARVGYVEPNSPAAKAGVQPGDVIVRLGDKVNPTWEDVELKVPTSPGEAIPITVLRDGRKLDLILRPRAEGEEQTGYAGWSPCLPASIGLVEPGSPASKAGLRAGDEIVALDGVRIPCWQSLTAALQSHGGKPLEITLRRDGRDLSVQVMPVYGEVQGTKKWHIGVGLRDVVVVRRLPWSQALSQAIDFNIRNSLLTVDVIGKILTRRMSAKSLSSPIGIAQLSGEAYRAGWVDLLMFVSLISLQLGLFNLLPIPILDGGMILMLVIEGILRRDVSMAVKERVVQVGLAVLLLLAVYVMYNDILKTFKPY